MSRITPDGAARRAAVVRMRSERRTFAEIGAALKITSTQAHRLYQDQLRREPIQALAEHRQEEMILIDRAQRDLLTRIATDPTASLRTVAEAWGQIRGWSEYKSRLLGLFPPIRQQIVITEDAVRQAISECEAAIAAENAAIAAADAALGGDR